MVRPMRHRTQRFYQQGSADTKSAEIQKSCEKHPLIDLILYSLSQVLLVLKLQPALLFSDCKFPVYIPVDELVDL